MTDTFKEQLQQAHAQGDYASLLDLIPYARLIGVECSRVGDELLFRLPANKDNIGNPLLPAIHGGVIAGFMELSAALHLLIFTGSPGVPKIIDFFPRLPARGAVSRYLGQMPGVPTGASGGKRGNYRLAKHRSRAHCHGPRSLQNRRALEILISAPQL